LSASENCAPAASAINLNARLKELDDERLSAIPDAEMVALVMQRKYFADLRRQEACRKKKQRYQKKLRFKRPMRG
jgi:hypothetical protein